MTYDQIFLAAAFVIFLITFVAIMIFVRRRGHDPRGVANGKARDAVISNFAFHEVRDARDKRDIIREALRVLRKGGWFSLQDVFLDKRVYGDIDDLLDHIREWGIEQVHFSDASSLDWLPPLLRMRTPLTVGVAGVAYGRK